MWALLLAAALAADPDPDEPSEESEADRPVWQDEGWGWGALPALNYNSDNGFGYGFIGSIYRYDGETSPYRWSMTALLFLTTKQVHDHYVQADVVDLANDRLRLTGRAGLNVSRTEPYCGMGGDASCDLSRAEDEAAALGLTGADRSEFLDRYYFSRYTRAYGFAWARYKLLPDPKIEALLGYRLTIYRDGDLGSDGPYPGSLYDQEVRGPESEGVYSQLSAGAMFDTRDFEPSPSRGWWIEGTLRGASKAWGSQFDAFGSNLTVRTYAPLVGRKLVLASRTIGDGFVGDVPPREAAEIGGTTPLSGFGGGDAGRGIRVRRYKGRVLMMQQLELRWWFVRIPLGKTPLDLTLLGFADAAHVADRWTDLGQTAPILGEGAGLRIAIGESFIVRVDTGWSAVEDYSMGLYIDVNNLF